MRLNLLACLLIGAVSSTVTATAPAGAQESYTAKLVRTKGLSKETVDIDLQISRWATQDEADALLSILNEGGSDAVIRALRDNDFGKALVTGGNTRQVVWARLFPGQNGSSVMIVTDAPIYFPSDPLDTQASNTALGVFQLEVNDRGQGRGRLAQAVALDVTDEGVLQIQSAHPATIDIEDVRRER